MRLYDTDAMQAAQNFVWVSGRLLERLRFGHLLGNVEPARVVDALRPYQNPDGGFGEAIEPDFRGPISQPLGIDTALRLLDEVGVWDRAIVDRIGAYLTSIEVPGGGVPNVLSSVVGYPHAPWWEPADDHPPASLLPTASVAGLLHRHGVEHPWLGPATDFCWRALAEIPARLASPEGRQYRVQIAYESRAVVLFLDNVPDRDRAREAAAALGRALLDDGVIALDPAEAGEAANPLDFAPHPDTLARQWFADDVIDAHLDALIAAQQADGGWRVEWLIWTPLTEFEWRGIQTTERVKTLLAYGRAQPSRS